MLSLIFSIVSLLLFAKPPKLDYFPATISNSHHEKVFEIVTDRRHETIEFSIKMPHNLWILPLNSVKWGKVKAAIDYSVGF
jgi:hypothetical protein